MSVTSSTLGFMPDEDLIELAQSQAALTNALAERLEMARREIEDLQTLKPQTEFYHARSNNDNG